MLFSFPVLWRKKNTFDLSSLMKDSRKLAFVWHSPEVNFTQLLFHSFEICQIVYISQSCKEKGLNSQWVYDQLDYTTRRTATISLV